MLRRLDAVRRHRQTMAAWREDPEAGNLLHLLLSSERGKAESEPKPSLIHRMSTSGEDGWRGV